MFRGLQGKTALVTGGAKGIGRAIVERFLDEGCRVVVIDLDIESLRASFQPGSFVVSVQLDISNKEEVAKNLAALTSMTNIDILVNNAAITEGDDYEAIMNTNVSGTRYVTEAVLPGMIARGGGSVVFITSVHTAMAFLGDASYDMSKHAVVGYMRARACELATKGVRLNAVAPGAIQNAGNNTDPASIAESSKRIPMRRFGNPGEIASIVAFLASDEASYVTGAEWRVDGGLSVQSPFR